MSQKTEHDWVERAKRGEPTAVAELYRRYWRAARATAYGVTGDWTHAEDAAAEAFYAVLESLPTLREAERFGPWLRTITLRTARQLKAAHAAQNVREASARPVTRDGAPEVRLEQQEMAALVREAVARLPQILREATCLFYFEGYDVEAAARFLGLPTGTLKRRLHEGRQRLRETAVRIGRGERPMDQERERVLRQLQELIDKPGDSEAIYQVMREAFGVRPVPHELLRTLLRRQAEAGRATVPPEELAKEEELVRRHWDEITHPSSRATDPGHPVGAVANAIRAALPEFQERPAIHVDFDTAKRWMQEQDRPLSMPPEYAEGRPFSHWSAGRGLLIEDAGGAVYTQFELFQNKTSRQDMEAAFRRGFRVSDVLTLSWLRPKPLELREVEVLLRRLADAVLPGTPISFTSSDGPRYRCALRMQLGALAIPGATGGILNPLAGMPSDVELASVRLYLEAWASARSGQTIELAEPPFPLFATAATP
jgi:RNA polymerase sigma factor (sigma-70 family)